MANISIINSEYKNKYFELNNFLNIKGGEAKVDPIVRAIINAYHNDIKYFFITKAAYLKIKGKSSTIQVSEGDTTLYVINKDNFINAINTNSYYLNNKNNKLEYFDKDIKKKSIKTEKLKNLENVIKDMKKSFINNVLNSNKIEPQNYNSKASTYYTNNTISEHINSQFKYTDSFINTLFPEIEKENICNNMKSSITNIKTELKNMFDYAYTNATLNVIKVLENKYECIQSAIDLNNRYFTDIHSSIVLNLKDDIDKAFAQNKYIDNNREEKAADYLITVIIVNNGNTIVMGKTRNFSI
jgi:hypothetical protein